MPGYRKKKGNLFISKVLLVKRMLFKICKYWLYYLKIACSNIQSLFGFAYNCCCCLLTKSCSTCDPMDYSPARLLCPWDSFYNQICLNFNSLSWWLSGKESTCQCRKQKVQSLSQQDPLEKEMATHYSIFAWEIQRTEEPVWLQFMELQRVSHNLATNNNNNF